MGYADAISAIDAATHRVKTLTTGQPSVLITGPASFSPTVFMDAPDGDARQGPTSEHPGLGPNFGLCASGPSAMVGARVFARLDEAGAKRMIGEVAS